MDGEIVFDTQCIFMKSINWLKKKSCTWGLPFVICFCGWNSYFILNNNKSLATQCYMLNAYVLIRFELGLLYPLVATKWFFFNIFFFQLLNALQTFLFNGPPTVYEIQTFRYYKFFWWYFAQFNDIKFNRYFKFGFLVLLMNCLFDGVMQCFSFAPLFLWFSYS